MSASKIIQAYARKSLTKNQGSGIINLAGSMQSEAKAGEIVALLQRAGIPMNQLDDYIRSETDLLKFLNLIKASSEPRVISGSSAEGKAITEKLFGKKGEVVDMTGKNIDTSQGIMGGKSVKELMESGQVQKGTDNIKISEKITDRDMFNNSNLNKTDAQIKAEIEVNNKKSLSKMETNNFSLNTITKIKSMKPMDAMKEANLVAGKKGKYANLNDNQVKKIIDDTNDHIFERDIPIDPEDMARGGRAGYAVGNQVMPAIDPGMNLDYNTLVNQNTAQRVAQKNMRGMGKSGFQTQPGTLNQGTQRIQNIVMNQAPNRFADYLSGRTEPVTDLSEIASTQSTRDVINQGILGSLERNQITNPTGSFNTVVQSKGGGGEYASNRPVDYSGYKLGNPLPGIKNYAAEVGQVLNTKIQRLFPNLVHQLHSILPLH